MRCSRSFSLTMADPRVIRSSVSSYSDSDSPKVSPSETDPSPPATGVLRLVAE